jgi:hypothetical protein
MDHARLTIDVDAAEDAAAGSKQIDRNRVVADPYKRTYFDGSKAPPG